MKKFFVVGNPLAKKRASISFFSEEIFDALAYDYIFSSNFTGLFIILLSSHTLFPQARALVLFLQNE